jgi:hypothetical protein
MYPTDMEPALPASKLLQTLALDCSAIGIGILCISIQEQERMKKSN